MKKSKSITNDTTTEVVKNEETFTEVSSKSSFTKEDVPQLLNQLKERKKAILGNVEETINTNLKFNGRVIKDCISVKELLQISASIHAQEKAYAEEILRYNLDSTKIAEFTIDNTNVSNWKKAINKLIVDLINKTELKQIEEAEKELEEFLDANSKLARKMESIFNKASAPIL